MLCTVQRLIGDELRHTQVTATVVDWLGGRADLDIDLSDAGLPPRGEESAAERAAKIVARELVVAEEESIYALAAYRAASSEPAIRAVFDLLLVDEVRHAAAGRALLRLFDIDAAATIAEDRADLRAPGLRSVCVRGPGRALGASIELPISRRCGRHVGRELSPAERAVTLRRTPRFTCVESGRA